MMHNTGLIPVLLGFAALLAVGCGKKENAAASTSESPSSSAAQATVAGAQAPAAARAIEITGNDMMKFSLAEIRARPGETLTVTLVNVGTLPKASMGHNWVLLKAPGIAESFVNDALRAGANEYIPQNRMGDILAHTKILGPKERDSVTFQAPAAPGKYPFVCSFPGHYQVGMRGDLVVE